jgi:uncharacterized membrane protein
MAQTDDHLQTVRQPLVTATGIILGFTLNFAAGWVKSATSVNDAAAYLTFALVLAEMGALAVVLARILRRDVPAEQSDHYYAVTVRVFVLGVGLAIGGVVLDMASTFFT